MLVLIHLISWRFSRYTLSWCFFSFMLIETAINSKQTLFSLLLLLLLLLLFEWNILAVKVSLTFNVDRDQIEKLYLYRRKKKEKANEGHGEKSDKIQCLHHQVLFSLYLSSLHVNKTFFIGCRMKQCQLVKITILTF